MATKREWLAAQGLAKPGTRGRFGKAAHEALEQAEKDGIVFDDPTPKPAKEVATEGAEAPSKPSRPTSENAEIRAWARDNGFTIGERGRISAEILAAYHGDPIPDNDYVPPPPQVRVRPARVMYGFDNDGHKIGFATCGRCAEHISYCECSEGIKTPFGVNAIDESLTEWYTSV